MAYTEGLAELLKRVSQTKNKEKKIAILRRDHSWPLEVLVDLCYNPRIEWLIPEGEPPYTPARKAEDLQGILKSNHAIRRFKIYIKGGGYEKLNQFKREQQFVNMLESIDPDDAKLVLAIKEGKMPYKGVTRELFNEAWPALASTWGEEKKVEEETTD